MAMALPREARLNIRFGERPVLLTGLGLIITGLALLSWAPVSAGFPVGILPAMLLIGAGSILSQPEQPRPARPEPRSPEAVGVNGEATTAEARRPEVGPSPAPHGLNVASVVGG